MSKLLSKIWNAITYVRLGLANIVFIIFIIFLISVLSSGEGHEPIPEDAPLVISFSGYLVDKSSYEPTPLDLLSNDLGNKELVVRDITYAIRAAATDTRINALVLNLSPFAGGGVSKINEVAQALESFKESGKPVYAYADNYSQQQYLLASHADTIYINSMGGVSLTGIGVYRNFYKDAADKLALKFHVFRVGEYKDAVEPYIRNGMSDDSREHNSVWLNEIWQKYTADIENNRELEAGSIAEMIANLDKNLDKKVSLAQFSLNAGLVDQIVSRNELDQLFIEKFGKGEKDHTFKGVGLSRYLSDIKPLMPSDKNNIGLIVAAGTIVDGEGTAAQIGSFSMRDLVNQAAKDDSLKALVIRVDSGGGSAFASEMIRDAIASARKKGLPVYISMGSVAASGGYWIATDAEEVWATPTTITGSIGVFGLIPNISESLEKIGVHNDGVGTTELADAFQIGRPMSDKAKTVIQSSVDNIYVQFLDLVANARGMSVEDVHKIAQGRVWTGSMALDLGLVDTLGSLNDLMEHVAQKHEMTKYSVKPIKRPLSTYEQFVQALQEQASVIGGEALNAKLTSLLPGSQNLMQDPAWQAMGQTQQAQSLQVFAQCFACEAP